MDDQKQNGQISNRLSRLGYWPAQATEHLENGRFSRAVEICKEKLVEQPNLLSGLLIYARALFEAGQTEASAEQFYKVLVRDPENVVAMKYLGDIKFSNNDQFSALADYRRVWEIDPYSTVLSCPIKKIPKERTRTISIVRKEPKRQLPEPNITLRNIPFYTETIGDLYLAQGHNRLAVEVFKVLNENDENPKIREKLELALKKIKLKESS